jgi:hydrogenase-4 membrane subunit HyfE
MSAETLTGPFAIAGFALLALSSGSIVTRDPRQNVSIYALASIPQAGIAVMLALVYGHVELYALAAAIVVLKGLIAPRLLVVPWPEAHRPHYALTGHLGTPAALAVIVGVLMFAYRVSVVLAPPALETAMAATMASGLVGLLAPAVRHELAAQAAGLLHGEAGMTATALLLVGHLPVTADVISIAELLVLALLLGVLLARVIRVHGRADASLLTALRG